MILFPNRVVALRTDVSPETVLARLAGAIGEPPGTILFGGAPAEPFVGELRGNTFFVARPLRQIERWGGTARTPRPVLEGEVQPDGVGTVVHLTVRAEEGFRSTEVVWLLMIAFVVYVAVAQAIRNPWDRVPRVVFSAVAASLPVLIRSIFCRGTSRAIARFTDVIEGRLAKTEASSP